MKEAHEKEAKARAEEAEAAKQKRLTKALDFDDQVANTDQIKTDAAKSRQVAADRAKQAIQDKSSIEWTDEVKDVWKASIGTLPSPIEFWIDHVYGSVKTGSYGSPNLIGPAATGARAWCDRNIAQSEGRAGQDSRRGATTGDRMAIQLGTQVGLLQNACGALAIDELPRTNEILGQGISTVGRTGVGTGRRALRSKE